MLWLREVAVEAKEQRAAERQGERLREGQDRHDSVERRAGEPARVELTDAGGSDACTAPAPGSELVPARRGNYRVLGEIARSETGHILRAHDPDLGRDVAIKVLDPRLAERADALRRFVEEAQVGGRLQHPGVAPVYELGLLADERPYFAMKLVEGRTLAELLAARREPADERGALLRVFESVCQTVAYAHSKGVIHRDLQPAKVMVGAFGEVQVMDWGLAKVLHRSAGVPSEPLGQRSVIDTARSGPQSVAADSLAGSVPGTPAYVSPEQARGTVESLDERSDVFALGAILCEILTGLPPYVEREGESLLQQAANAKLGDAVARLETCGADPELIELARTSLAPAPAARLQNGAAMANAMQVHLASAAERAREAELEAADERGRARAEGKARRLTVALSALGALATFAVAGSWIWRERHAADEFVRVESALTDMQASRLPEAVLVLDQVLAKVPEDARARAELAACLMALGDWPRAQRELEALERQGPASQERAADLAVARLRSGSIDESAFEARMAELARSSAYARIQWAAVLLDGTPSAADLERARELLSGASGEEWWALKCGLELAQGRPREALALLDDAALNGPAYVPPEREITWSALRSRALGALGERDEARAWLAAAERALAALTASAPSAWEGAACRAECLRARSELSE